MIEPSQLMGKKILVGITRECRDGSVELEQYSGIANVIDRQDYCSISIDCSDGETREYPFDVRSLESAQPGSYTLKSTGEIVTDPDYLMTWAISEGQTEE